MNTSRLQQKERDFQLLHLIVGFERVGQDLRAIFAAESPPLVLDSQSSLLYFAKSFTDLQG